MPQRASKWHPKNCPWRKNPVGSLQAALQAARVLQEYMVTEAYTGSRYKGRYGKTPCFKRGGYQRVGIEEEKAGGR